MVDYYTFINYGIGLFASTSIDTTSYVLHMQALDSITDYEILNSHRNFEFYIRHVFDVTADAKMHAMNVLASSQGWKAWSEY